MDITPAALQAHSSECKFRAPAPAWACPSSSVAVGLAGWAALAAVWLSVGALLQGAGAAERVAPAWLADCAAPVEVHEGGAVRVNCANAPQLAHCGALLAGDALQWSAGAPPTCVVRRGGMQAAYRLLYGLPLALNCATPADLQQLDGVGEKLAHGIVNYRQAHGPFTAVAQLAAVRGIGAGTVARLQPAVTVDPAACGGGEKIGE